MPKIGMEPVRRDALIRAAIVEVGAMGSLDVTVSRIARRAGVSPALAHHYFGSKEQILLAAMRRILTDFGTSVRGRTRAARTPRERLAAIFEACFTLEQFEPSVIVAWLNFYVHAHRSPDASRLLAIYARRLDSNLVHALRSLVSGDEARTIAQGIASMIDGLYIRAALQERAPSRTDAIAMVSDYLDLCLDRTKR
ncbi:transcriptional regulator BetI [Acuticoccus sediminis]|uniref:HTH-type transcriptional regulator BetI n=1 Tax=Acuticoccus sediminis TaxID=2184697 RepID=A0A8B2NYU0_9HYPH|nr:transcriptional regulator BetI [Acuticoccus sediminis]RAI03046.1 transcriptional regulator BetI [Acuticoccus sediminis]